MAKSVQISASFAALMILLSACTSADDGSTATSDPEPTDTPTAGATSIPPLSRTPRPTPTEVTFNLEVVGDHGWQAQPLEPDEAAPTELGALLVDVETGLSTFWFYPSGPTGRFSFDVFSAASAELLVDPTRRELLNTASGRVFSWPPGATFVGVGGEGTVILASPGCRLWLVDVTGDSPDNGAGVQVPTNAFGDCSLAARLAPDESELLVAQSGTSAQPTALYRFALADRSLELLAEVEHSSMRFDGGVAGDEVVALTDARQGVALVARYRWGSGELDLAEIEVADDPTADAKDLAVPDGLNVSPNGRWVSWRARADLGFGDGLRGFDEWPITVIANLDEERISVRAERVAATTGIHEFDWLPDSSAFVVQSEAGFGLLAPDGTLRDLAFPVAAHSAPAPLPAPDRIDRFAYDGWVSDHDGAVLDGKPAAVAMWRSADELDFGWWPRNRYRWGADSSRLILTRIEFGGDHGRGGIATLGLPALVRVAESAADHRPIQLRVAAGGDRLNARLVPGMGSDRAGQFEDGAIVTISRGPSEAFCGPLPAGCSILPDPDVDYDERWWIFVTGEGSDGPLEGWVSSEFLEWAE